VIHLTIDINKVVSCLNPFNSHEYFRRVKENRVKNLKEIFSGRRKERLVLRVVEKNN